MAAALWTKPDFTGLPASLLQAAAVEDWARVRDLLKTGIAPRGVYGRQILWFRRELPLGADPVLDQLRGDAALQFGDWDGVDGVLRAGRVVDAAELEGLRDAVLAPIGAVRSPFAATALIPARAWEHAFGFEVGRYRRLLRELIGWRPPLEARPDVSASRFIRMRRLQEAALMAHIEAIGGSLEAAIALGAEARDLGEEGDVLRLIAADTEALAQHARGGYDALELRYLREIGNPRGPAPSDVGTILVKMLPLLVAAHHPSTRDAAALAEDIAVRMGSPRLQLVARFWSTLAGHVMGGRPVSARDVAALRAETRTARPALRLLPELLAGLEGENAASFALAERLARRSGHVWAQVTALTWIVALAPSPLTARRLAVLLRLTGWRRPVAVPERVVGRAVEALLGLGYSDTWLVELARASAPSPAAAAAARVPAPASHPGGLSERELEVVQLAGKGLTNKEIAERLGLSPFTVARHVANARSKLGATNRSAAAMALESIRRGKAHE